MNTQIAPFVPDGLRWLYVDLNSFFASVEQQEDPRLMQRPVIVTPVDSEFTSAIAVSYEAKARGVRNGMSVQEARAVCPEVAVRPARHDVYVRYSVQITAEIEAEHPVDRVCSIDEVACSLRGRDRERPVAERIGRAIQQRLLARIGPAIRCSIGLASSRLLAKMACDMQKPLGLTVLMPEALPLAIEHLPLSDIPGVGRRMAGRLELAGITTMRQLWDLSPGRARAIWGSIEGEAVWLGLHGIDPPERPETDRQSIGHSVILPSAQRTEAGARPAARGLLMRAAARLRRMNYRARALSVSLALVPKGYVWRQSRFAPSGDTLLFLAEFDRLWLDLAREVDGRPVKRTGITLSGLQAPGQAQFELFDSVPPADTPPKGEALSSALDAITARFGRDVVRIGENSPALSRYSGAKIAFTRIPDAEDFL